MGGGGAEFFGVIKGGNIFFVSEPKGGEAEFFEGHRGRDQNFFLNFLHKAKGGPEFFYVCQGGTRKNWQPAITDRRPPLPVKNDSSLNIQQGNKTRQK